MRVYNLRCGQFSTHDFIPIDSYTYTDLLISDQCLLLGDQYLLFN